MSETAQLIQAEIATHILNPTVISSSLQNGKIQGRFVASNRVYNYVLSKQDLTYAPAGRQDSALFSSYFLARLDAIKSAPRIGNSKCTSKSYQCGKICLGIRRHCKKAVNDVERVAKIFLLAESDAKTGAHLQKQALANVAEGDRDKVLTRAQKLRNSEERDNKAKQLKGERNGKKNNQSIADVRSELGGSNSTINLPSSSDRIKVARQDLTQSADPDLIPERLRQHLNEFQIQGAALAIKSMDKQGGFLLADGTGIGKTRQLLAVAQNYADKGHKVVIITANEVLGKPNTTDWKKGNYTGSFKNDSDAMGIKATLIKGDTPLTEGQVHLSTYSNIGKLKNQVDKNTVVLYDEAHAMKNKDSAVTGHGKAINSVAGKVLFATATPADKPLHIDYLQRANVFAGMTRSQAYKHMGLELVDVRVKGGATIQAWQVPKGKSDEVLHRMAGLFDEMTENGNMIKREISLKGVTTTSTNILVPPEAHKAMQAIEDSYASETDRTRFKVLSDKRKQLLEELKPIKAKMTNDHYEEIHDRMYNGGTRVLSNTSHDFVGKTGQIRNIDLQIADSIDDGQRAQILMSQRRQIEPYKVPAAVESTKKALNEGKQVVVFLSRVNESETKDVHGNLLAGSEGTVKLLRERMIKEGIDPKLITELHGETNTKSADAQAAFQSGKAKVILATIESGGTGINLDDTKGNAPRHMIIMTPPFTAVDNLQAVGRIHRLNTKSPSSVEYLFTNTDVDHWSNKIIQEKMKTLGATVAGEIGELHTAPHPSLDKKEFQPAPRPPKPLRVENPTKATKEFADTIQELHPSINANAWVSPDGTKHRIYLEKEGNKTGYVSLDRGNVNLDNVHPRDRKDIQELFDKYLKDGAPKKPEKKSEPITIERRSQFSHALTKKIESDHPSLNAKYWVSPDGSKHHVYLKANGKDMGHIKVNSQGVDLSNVKGNTDELKKYSDELIAQKP
jgi:hypothetical protein